MHYGINRTPTNDFCWKASYKYHLCRAKKMLRIVEENEMGEGQIKEQQMVEAMMRRGVAVEIKEIRLTSGFKSGKGTHTEQEWAHELAPRLEAAGFQITNR